MASGEWPGCSVTCGFVWLPIAGLVVGVIGAWGNLRVLMLWLARNPLELVRIVRRVIACPDPLPIQIADMVDSFYVGLGLRLRLHDDPYAHPRLFTALNVSFTTWLRHPGRGLDSYRRHLRALREYEGLDPRLVRNAA